MRSNRSSNARGFTLVELLIVTLILSVIMAISYRSLQQMIRAKLFLDDSRDASAIANACLRRVTRELQLANGATALLPPKGVDAKTIAPRPFFLGEEKTLGAGRRGDRLQFVALGAGQYLLEGGNHSGLVEITYRVEEDPDSEASSEEAKTYYLVREETPHLRPIDSAYDKTMVFPITKNLVSLEFLYYDSKNDQWTSSWSGDPTKPRIPSIVQFRMRLRSPAGKILTYLTAVPLPSS